ncbi:MAG: SLBB domain-containing protein, partial [Actinobacteria bacterium]|nr:SLBB domain-containing protein [Actinomycetota bacterium]
MGRCAVDDRIEPLPARPLPRRPVGERCREWLVWFGAGRLVAVSLSVLAIGAGGYWLLRAPAEPIESSLPRATTTTGPSTAGPPSEAAATVTSPPPTSAASAPIVVHVAGHVVAPGVYTLEPGARVVDAVAAAGGPDDVARADAINLAEPLHDGDRVYVPGDDEAPEVAAGVTPVQAASAGGDPE